MKSKMTMLAVALSCVATVRAAIWTSADGLATIEAPMITEGDGTLAISGSGPTVTVASGDAVITPAVTVAGAVDFTISVADGASLTFASISNADGGRLNRLTKNGGGELVIAGGTLNSKYCTYTAGGFTLKDGANLVLGYELQSQNAEIHTVNLLNGATLRCSRPRADSTANGANTSLHADGGILQPTANSYIFANIPTVTVGAGGLYVDTTYAPAGIVWQFGKPTTASGVAADGGLHIRGDGRQTSLVFHNSYPPSLTGGIVVEDGGCAAFDDVTGSGSLALAESAVTVKNGGELRMLGRMSRLSTVKDLTLGETAGDTTCLRFSASATAILVVTNSLSVNGTVYVRFPPDTLTSGTYSFLRAPKGSLDAVVSSFALDPTVHDGVAGEFSVNTANAEYDVLKVVASSSFVKIDPAVSDSSTLTLKNKTLRTIAAGIVANPIVGQANDGFVLDTPYDVEFTNTFQNAGYFIKTGAGRATLSYDGDIRISGKSGNNNTYRKSESLLVFPETGGMPTVDGTSVVSAGANVMDFNVLAGTLALAASGTVSHKGDMLVGGNKLFLDGSGEPIPATVELDDGTLNMTRIFVGDVHAYRGEAACLEKRPRNSLVVRGGTMNVSTAFVIGNYNDSYHNGVDEYVQYGGTVMMPASYFHIGRLRTSSNESWPDVGQTQSRFAIYGGSYTKTGDYNFNVSERGGDSEVVFGGGTSVISRINVAANSSTADTKSTFEISGGMLVVSNITLKSSFAGMASWEWNGGTFKPATLAATEQFAGPWTTNAVDAGGAKFDLSGMDEGTVYRMAIPLTHAAALGETADGGVRVTEGPGVLALAAANTFTGPVVIDGGTLRAEVAGAIPATATVEVNAGGVLDLAGLTITVANVCGNGGIISNGTLRVTGEVRSDALSIESLVLAEGATISVPLACEDSVWSAGTFTVTDAFSAEGPVNLAMVELAEGVKLPKDFSIQIATLPAGSCVTLLSSDAEHVPDRHKLQLSCCPGEGGTVALHAFVQGPGFMVIVR